MHNYMLSKSIGYQNVIKVAVSIVWGLRDKKRWFVFLLELAVKQIKQILKNKGSKLIKASFFFIRMNISVEFCCPWIQFHKTVM